MSNKVTLELEFEFRPDTAEPFIRFQTVAEARRVAEATGGAVVTRTPAEFREWIGPEPKPEPTSETEAFAMADRLIRLANYEFRDVMSLGTRHGFGHRLVSETAADVEGDLRALFGGTRFSFPTEDVIVPTTEEAFCSEAELSKWVKDVERILELVTADKSNVKLLYADRVLGRVRGRVVS